MFLQSQVSKQCIRTLILTLHPKKYFYFILPIILIFVISPLAKAGEKTVMRIGIYDSRAIAVAYRRSAFLKEYMRGLSSRYNSADNKKEMSKVEAEVKEHQKQLQAQGFSTVSVDNLLKHIKKSLPDIRKKAAVDIILSKWDKKSLSKYKTAQKVDVTMLLVKAFKPNAQTLKIVEQRQTKKTIPVHKSYTCNFNNGLENWFTNYKGPNKQFLTLAKDKSSQANKYVVILSEFDDQSSNKSLNIILFPTKKGKIFLSGKVKGLSGHEKIKIENFTQNHSLGCKYALHEIATLPVTSQWTNFKVDLGKCAANSTYLQIRILAAKDIKGKDKRQDLRFALDDLRIEGAEFMIKSVPPIKKKKIIARKIKKDSLPAIRNGKNLTSQQILGRLYLCKYPVQLAKQIKEIRKSSDIDTFNVALRAFWKKSLFSKGLRYEKYEALVALNPDWTLKITNRMIDLKKIMRNRIKINDAYSGLVLQAVHSNGTVFLLLKKDGYMRIGSMDLKSAKIKILNQTKEIKNEFEYFNSNHELTFFTVAEGNAYINTKKNEFYCLPLNGEKVKKLKNWPGRVVSYVTAMKNRLYVVVDKRVIMSSRFDGTDRKLIASLKRDIATNDIEKAMLREYVSKIFSIPAEDCLFFITHRARTIKYFPKAQKSQKISNFPFIDAAGSNKLFTNSIGNEIHVAVSGGFRPQCLIYDISNEKTKLQTGIRIKGIKQFFCRENEIYYTCSKSSSGIYNYKKPVKSPVLFLPTAIAIYPHSDGKSFYLIGLDIILKITPKK